MKKIVFIMLAFLGVGIVSAQNPIITKRYSADPTARVFGNTLYLYPSHDRDEAKWWDMEDYYVYSTTDMKKWKDCGLAFSPLKETTWAKKYAWAPDCVERDGKYYFYFPTDQKHIGVAISDSPTGPFKDAIGKPLISINSTGVVCNRDFIDPSVFIDDDGQAYLFVGQIALNCVKINKDMVSYSDPVQIIKGVDGFFEAIWMHKYKGKYYLSYSTAGTKEYQPQIAYAIADNIVGPYKYQGVILDAVSSGTNHHSIVDFKGKSYLFYHTSDLSNYRHPEGTPDRAFTQWRRSVCVEELHYNADGTIKPVKMSISEKQLRKKLGK